jgi:2-keto-4-pentenoate hydratase/2-oxohepta-3-ene-1,7-dioic acid hydratase in catechol pathway
MKPSTAVIGPDRISSIRPCPGGWITRRSWRWSSAGPAGHVPEEDFRDYVLGYTCINDVTARDLQKKDGQFTRAKSFDTFAALGPWIETEIGDPDNLMVEAYLNGERRQHSSTNNMVFGVAPW